MARAGEIQALVKEFADCVAAQGNEIRHGDPEVGNAYAARYIAAFDALREIGDEGRDALAVLFFDRRVDVRVTAAAYLLRYKPAESVAVLKKESAGYGFIAFEAGELLRRWNDGSWALDPE